MPDYYFNDYDKFIGKNITVIYECGYKCKKLNCELLEYCKKSSKEKIIILKTYNNIIYHMNCNKIIYWIAEYEDMLIENQDVYKLSTKPIESNAIAEAENENLFLEEVQDKESIPLETSTPNLHLHGVGSLQNEKNNHFFSISSFKENTSLTLNKHTTCNELQENKAINKLDAPLEPVSNAVITSNEPNINPIMVDMKFNHDKSITDYKKDCDCDKIQEQFNHKDTYKKNVLMSPLSAFINCNFQGSHLTIYTTSAQSISGEVIFNYDYLIVLKSDGKTYYINPEQITYFC